MVFKKIFLKTIFLLLPLSTYTSTLNSSRAKIFTQLDRVIAAERYWQELSYHPFKRAITRTPLSWFGTSWREEIPEKLARLKAIKQQLACYLTTLEVEQQQEPESFGSIEQEVNQVLADNGIPSHFTRNWVGYSCAALCATGLIFKLKQFLHKNVVFSFSASEKTYDRIISNLSSLKTTPPLSFHATKANNEWIIRTGKQCENLVKKQLIQSGIHPQTLVTRSPELSDLRLIMNNQEGKNILSEFARSTLIEPVKNLHDKLFEKQVVVRPSTDLIQAVEEYKEGLKELAQIALKEKNYEHFFTEAEKESRTILINRSIEELERLRNHIITGNLSRGLPEGVAYWLGRKLSGRPSSLSSACLSKYREVSVHALQASRTMKVVDQKLNIVIELFAMMPAACVGAAGYQCVKKWVKQRHRKTIQVPLEQDLRDFQALLDQYKHAEKLDAYFYGMRSYLLARLHSYMGRITSDRRMHFDRDLRRLSGNISVDHQLSIVTSLLHYGVAQF